jgi:hypothetical protein
MNLVKEKIIWQFNTFLPIFFFRAMAMLKTPVLPDCNVASKVKKSVIYYCEKLAVLSAQT